MSDLQTDMFAEQPDLIARPPTSAEPSRTVVLERLEALLAIARAADRMPWNEQRVRVNWLLFHNMAKWLPDIERNSLCSAFDDEIARLRGASR